MRRGRRSSAPPAATSERLASGIPSFAPFAATIRSQERAISIPPATANPSIAAISGLRAARWAIPAKPRSPNHGDSPLTNAPRSMPALKNPPAPVTTPTSRFSSPSSSSSAPPTPAASAAFTEFRTSGRLSVITRALPRRSATTGSVETAGSLALIGLLLVRGLAAYLRRGLARRRLRLAGGRLRLGGVLADLRRLRRRVRRRGLRLGRLRGRLGGLRGALLERAAELSDPLAQGASELGQALGPEHDQRHESDEEQMNGVLDAHAVLTAAVLRAAACGLRQGYSRSGAYAPD